jgi:hypothetical protein
MNKIIQQQNKSTSATAVEVVRNARSNLRVIKTALGGKTSSALMTMGKVFSSAIPRGMPMLAPDLVPLCRCIVSSTLAIFNAVLALGQGTSTFVADPSGTATNALGVFQWSTRFSGFQQYRLRKTEWKLTPLRTFQNTSGSVGNLIPPGGYSIAYIEDDPQAGAPSQAVALASYPRARVIHNSTEVHTVSFASNEPSDLDLSDISTPPNKIVAGVVNQGAHCLQLYTDDGFFGLNTSAASGTQHLIGVQALYDIEFFGIGGV